MKDRDAEIARRADDCLRQLERVEKRRATGPGVTSAALRLLAVRKPAGAAEALLDFLPFADHETLVEEVETALSPLPCVTARRMWFW